MTTMTSFEPPQSGNVCSLQYSQQSVHLHLPASSKHPLLSSSSGRHRRIRESPLILSLPIHHIIQLIFHLPAPTPPSPAFAGGTPTPTPPITPANEDPPPLFSTPEGDEATEVSEDDDEVTDDGVGRRRLPARRGGAARGAAGIMPDVGRIPGEYRTGTVRGDGG